METEKKQNLPAESTKSNTGKQNKIKTEKGSRDLEVTRDLYSAALAEQQGEILMQGVQRRLNKFSCQKNKILSLNELQINGRSKQIMYVKIKLWNVKKKKEEEENWHSPKLIENMQK